MSNQKLQTALTETKSTTAVDKPNTIFQYLQSYKDQIAVALPKHMTADRMARIVTTEVRKVPDLLKCNPISLFGAVIQCSQLGLEPGNALGHAYLLPFYNSKTKQSDVQLIIGYRGMLDLARRSNQISSISVYEVYDTDEFEVSFGLNPDIKHKRDIKTGGTGNLIAVYAVATLKDGGKQFEVMTKAQIDDIKKSSKAANSQYSPWTTHYNEMAKKGLALDTPIPTPSGWTTMENLQVGHTVFDMNGIPVEVVAVSEIKNLPCFKVHFSNGDSIICDDEHKWVARVGGSNAYKSAFTVKTVNELYEAKEDGLSITIPMQGALELPDMELPIDPYLLGYWLGNGNSHNANITCNLLDSEFLINEITKSKYSVGNNSKDKHTNAYAINITGNFITDLRNLGVLKNKHVPNIYLRSSIKQRRALLQGLMDSDGHIDKARGRAHFYSTNINLANAVTELIISLGDVPHRSTKRMKGFNVECIAHFVGWKPSFCCVRVPRKRSNYCERKINAYRSVKSIEKIPSVPTKCIAVTGESKTYLAGISMAVTHNTVIRRLFKYLPVSIEIQQAVGLDEQAEAGLNQGNSSIINAENAIDISDFSSEAQPDDNDVAPDIEAKAKERFGE